MYSCNGSEAKIILSFMENENLPRPPATSKTLFTRLLSLKCFSLYLLAALD